VVYEIPRLEVLLSGQALDAPDHVSVLDEFFMIIAEQHLPPELILASPSVLVRPKVEVTDYLNVLRT